MSEASLTAREGRRVFRFRRGFDIPIPGRAERRLEQPAGRISTVAVKPRDWHGLAPIPKLQMREGSRVRAGEKLFWDKNFEGLWWTAPWSGEIVEIRRGPKRRVEEIVILAEGECESVEFVKGSPAGLGREKVIETLVDSGLWVYMRQRPYGIVANPKDKPSSVFISAYNTAPLAAEIDFLIEGSEEDFLIGLEALRTVVDCPINLFLREGHSHNEVFLKCEGVRRYWFTGPHPSGNVGVHIHHLDPVYKGGKVVWYIAPQELVYWGRLFRTGRVDMRRRVAVAGPEVVAPVYMEVPTGAVVEPLVKGRVREGRELRYISGDVLTGRKVELNGHLGAFDYLVSVVEEGNFPEFMGWLFPSFPRVSLSRTFLSTWLRMLGVRVNYRFSTRTYGEERPFVVTGEYERVLPMSLFPQHLLKAIIVRDFELMEELGIREVVEEDLALCEFVCTSKVPVQKILREGIELFRKEMG